jgi:hypothetical protein
MGVGKGSRRIKAIFGSLAVAAVLGAVAVSFAFAGTPGRFVVVESGEVGNTSWAVGMARIHNERCYGMKTVRDGWEGLGKVCGKGGPLSGQKVWRRAIGDGGEGEDLSIELDLTSKRVWTLNLLLGHPGSSREPDWRQFHTHVLNAKQAKASHLPRDFRFAVLTDSGNLCVESVEAFDRRGSLLLDESVPCEY